MGSFLEFYLFYFILFFGGEGGLKLPIILFLHQAFHLQYCAKVMQTNYGLCSPEMPRGLSRNVERNYGQKFVPKTKFRGNIVRKVKRKIALAKICGNKKELQRYTAVKA